MLGLAHVSEAAVDVLCVVDISQMVARINLFGLLIPTANRNCDYDQLRRDGQEIDDEQRKTCAQFLLLNIINADLFLGVLTDSLTQCSGSLNIPANCATNIFSIVGTVTLIAQAGFQIEYSCVEQEDNLTKLVAEKKAEVQKAKTDVERDVRKFLNDRGFDVALLPPAPAVAKNRVYEATAACFGSIVLSATFVMRLGVIMADTAIHCPRHSGLQEKVCALDLLGVLGLTSATIRFVATSVLTCSAIVGESNPTAACLQASSALPTGVFSAAAVLGNVDAACRTALSRWDPAQWPVKDEFETEGEELPKSSRKVFFSFLFSTIFIYFYFFFIFLCVLSHFVARMEISSSRTPDRTRVAQRPRDGLRSLLLRCLTELSG